MARANCAFFLVKSSKAVLSEPVSKGTSTEVSLLNLFIESVSRVVDTAFRLAQITTNVQQFARNLSPVIHSIGS